MNDLERAYRLAWMLKYPGQNRCAVCSFPLAAGVGEGCIIGNCSYRPQQGTAEHGRISRNLAELSEAAGIILAEFDAVRAEAAKGVLSS